MPSRPSKTASKAADDWRPIQLQMIAFCGTPPAIVEQNWYREVTGESPHESVTKRHERVHKGVVDGTSVSVTADLARVTITTSPKPLGEVQEIPRELPNLGPFGPARDRLLEYAVQWLGGSHPPLTRLSFVGKLIQQVNTREAGNKLAAKYLPSIDIHPTAIDLLYRVGYPRLSKSGIRDLKINRLASWSVIRVALHMRQSGPAGDEASRTITDDMFAAHLELDINTDAEYTSALPQGKLASLMRELVSLGSEIAARGEAR